MEITIHEEKISHFTFHGKKKGPITSHKNTLYHPPNRPPRPPQGRDLNATCYEKQRK